MITYHPEMIQGSEEWASIRRGLLTASEMKLILTPTLKTADNAASRAHVYEIAAQRISGYVEPTYVGDDMLRGMEDEIEARALYSEKYAPVTECGFVTNDEFGFTIGCSPDGLISSDGGLECKGRRQKFQIQAISSGEMPDDYALQVQTCLMVTRRAWWDFVSWSGGLPMFVVRALPDLEMQAAIIKAATLFEARVNEVVATYHENVARFGYLPTERRIEQEMFV